MQERHFFSRHIGLRPNETQKMLDVLKLDSLDALISQAVPHSIHLGRSLNLPKAVSEREA
ncbi:hypothetical protein, partial [Bartonella capreoli]